MNQFSHLPASGDDHDRQVYLHPFLPTYETSSPLPCAIFFRPCEEGSSEIDHQRSPPPQHEAKVEFFSTGSDNLMGSVATTGDGESSHKDGDGEECNPLDGGSGKWMSSKMRFMRKMTGSDKVASGRPRKNALGSNDHLRKFAENNVNNDNHSLPNGSIRVCSECNTTKTPLWRSGPGGPKSLCNACGIRQRKARRAMAAAAAAVTGGLIPAVAPVVKVRKQKRSGGACAVPFKKRFKCFAAAETRHKLHFDELTIALSKNSAFHGVFPQDEKEAAILLMALSSGLIRG